MTVCIAAICENGKSIVVAADRMFTSPLNLEFETEEKKIESLLPACVALTAGSSAGATEILDATRREIANSKDPTVEQVANETKNQFTIIRSLKIEENVILPTLGTDFMEQRQKGKTLPEYLQVQGQMYQQLLAVANQFNLQVELIVAGVDKTGSHIFVITHPGTSYSMDKLGYAAVGAGGMHATISLSLTAQTCRRSLFETLHSVYDAKKASEVAPGVGTATDIAIIDSSGVWECTQPMFDALEKAHCVANARQTPDLGQLKEAYDAERKPSQPAPQRTLLERIPHLH